MNLRLQAIYLMCAGKKWISSNQLHRTVGVALKTAWFMFHRIRLSMPADTIGTFGSGDEFVEVDETFVGRKPDTKVGRVYYHKIEVIRLDVCETGRARSMVVDKLTIAAIAPILTADAAKEATLDTNEALQYSNRSSSFAADVAPLYSIQFEIGSGPTERTRDEAVPINWTKDHRHSEGA